MTDRLTDQKEFRLQNKRLSLTYKTHLDKFLFTRWIKEVACKNYKVEFMAMAHENGKDDPVTPYEHTHVAIKFAKAFQSRDARRFDYEDIHPHIEGIKTALHFERLVRYLGKEDPENADLLKYCENKVDKIQSEPTLLEAIKNNLINYNDVMGIKAIYAMKEEKKECTEAEEYWSKWKPREWQQVIMDKIINEKADNRSVVWIYDKVGNTGKSNLIRYLRRERGKEILSISSVGKVSDVLHVIRKGVDSGWTGKALIIDLARAYEDRDSVYEVIENVKNGEITATKYDGESIDLPGEGFTHVVIMANFKPKTWKMSRDRWRGYEITESMGLKSLTLEDLSAKRIRIVAKSKDVKEFIGDIDS